MKSKFFDQDVDDVFFLANKGMVVLCFVDRNYTSEFIDVRGR